MKGGAFELGIDGLGGLGVAHGERKSILEEKDSLGEGSEAGSRSGWAGLSYSVQQGRADIQRGVELELDIDAWGQTLGVVERLAPPPAVTANKSEIKYKA